MIARRPRTALAAAVTLVGALLLVSLFLNLVPGDPVDIILGEQAAAVDRAALRHAVGLDLPWYGQLGRFLRDTATGELKTSVPPFERRILPQLAAALPRTLELTFAALALAILIALPLGMLAASRAGSRFDAGAMTASMAGAAVPRFWLGPMLIILFAIKLHWLPVSGADSARNLVLPALTLGVALAAFLARMVRASVLDTLDEDYVRTARAKGVSRAGVLWRHALPNAALPILTVLGLEFGALLGGSIVTEKVFSWPGMGTLLLSGISRRDFNLVRATVLVFTFAYVLVNLGTELLYRIVDPRLRRR